MRKYVGRLADTKEKLAAKNSIHMVNGLDVARAIIATSESTKVWGQRWLVTDVRSRCLAITQKCQ